MPRSRLMRGELERFSLARILRFLVSAGRDVHIVLPATGKAKRRTGRVVITSSSN